MSHVTGTPLSRSKGQSQLAGAGSYCGGLSHSLLATIFDEDVTVAFNSMTAVFSQRNYTAKLMLGCFKVC